MSARLRRMTPLRRWLVVGVLAVGTLAVAFGPAVVTGTSLGRIASGSAADLSADDLLAKLSASPRQGWSGYVETNGALLLPDAGDLDDVGGLLGEENRLRVWWRGPRSWRVDRLLTAGESDLRHQGARTMSYSYEAQEAKVGVDPEVRLPRTSDLVPVELVRHLLTDRLPRIASDLEVTALPERRVGDGLGRPAAGLRLSAPAAARSTIGHVDVWADPGSGVPLLVRIYARGDDQPMFTSTVRDFEAGTPPASRIALDPSADTEVDFERPLDIAAAADQYAPVRPPPVVAGLRRTAASDRAVGLYGEGLTQLIAIPLRGRDAGALRDQLAVTPGAKARDALLADGDPATGHIDTIGLLAGPLAVLVSGSGSDAGWLVAGTVRLPVLAEAARDLALGAEPVEGGGG